MKASRRWICVRLATYEDKRETEFLEMVFTGRSGQLENTVFALVSPDCKTYLAAPGRSPRSDFSDSGDLADALNWYADIAACEGLPLVVVGADAWTRKLEGFAGDQALFGLAVFVRETESPNTTVEVPDAFGLKAQSKIKLDPSMSLDQLKSILRASQSGPKDMRAHMTEGRRRGIRWQTKVPVTDPEARY